MSDFDFLPPDKKAAADLRSRNPWSVIKEAAQQMGILVFDPKPNCKKCYGRGYTGIKHDTGEPIPCSCIFPPEDREVGEVTLKPRNRAERRVQKKKA